MLACSVLLSIGSGLITTWTMGTPTAIWVGYQLLPAAGSGLGMSQVYMAPETVLDAADISNGAAILLFAQMFGGAIFLGVAENVFANRLSTGLVNSTYGADPELLLHAGATDLRTTFTGATLDKVLQVYNDAIMDTLYIPVTLAAVSLIGALAMEWKSIHMKSMPT